MNAAVLWAQQRQQCLTCKHLRKVEPGATTRASGTAVLMHCDARMRPNAKRLWGCSHMRAADGKCGPDAKLWEAA